MSLAATADTSNVKRRSIKVIKTRLEDVVVGDAVNRHPDAEMGWFVVHGISTLFNGHLQLADETEQLTVSGTHNDMVGLQLVEEVELDDRGVLAPPAPAIIAAPAVQMPAAPEQSTPAVTTPQPAAPQPTAAPQPAAPQPAAPQTSDSPIDAAAESAAAAEVATGMQTPPGVPTGVNLALVAELLEDLDVGDAPIITTEAAPPEPEVPAKVAMPEGAIAVYGDTLPETPSYKNPVVVPEGTLLPRRSRAA